MATSGVDYHRTPSVSRELSYFVDLSAIPRFPGESGHGLYERRGEIDLSTRSALSNSDSVDGVGSEGSCQVKGTGVSI